MEPISNFGTVFNEFYPTWDDFNTKVMAKVQDFVPNSNFFIDPNPNRLTPFKSIYDYFSNIYNNRPTRFNNELDFGVKFIAVFLEYYPALYIKQLTFIKKEYDGLVEKTERDQSQTEQWSLTDVVTIARKNNEAFTNVGAIGDDTSIILDPANDKIYQKTGTDDQSTNTTTYGKLITKEDFNLFRDMKEILDSNIYFGLQEFAQHFINLFRNYF